MEGRSRTAAPIRAAAPVADTPFGPHAEQQGTRLFLLSLSLLGGKKKKKKKAVAPSLAHLPSSSSSLQSAPLTPSLLHC